MRYQPVKRYSRLILLLCAEGLLSACESGPQTVYVDRIVEKPVPVLKKLDSQLTKDCAPSYLLPQEGPLTIKMAIDRLEASEVANSLCRNQLELIRAAQSADSPAAP